MRRLHLLLALIALPAASASAAELGGSRASIRHQHEVAKEHDFTFLKTPAQVREFVEKERLEEVVANEHLDMANVSFPYTRPVVKTFIERLAKQFFQATGEKLVVTSLTRPTSTQPRNASPYSVHPAGMAVDFRVPATPEGRQWLEEALLSLERRALLDATRERYPPHYHVAVFPDAYQAYVNVVVPREIREAMQVLLEGAVTMAIAAASRAAVPTPARDTAPPVPGGIVLAAVGGLVMLMLVLRLRGTRRAEAAANE